MTFMAASGARPKLICEERLRLLEVAFVKATRAEKTARTTDEFGRLRHSAHEAQDRLQSARRELTEHKRHHACVGEGIRRETPPLQAGGAGSGPTGKP